MYVPPDVQAAFKYWEKRKSRQYYEDDREKIILQHRAKRMKAQELMKESLAGPREGDLSVPVLVVSLCLIVCMLCRVVQLPWASRQWPSLQRLQQGQRHAPDAALLIRSRSLGPRSGRLAGAMHGEQEMGHV